MGDWTTCENCGERHPVAEKHTCPAPKAEERLDERVQDIGAPPPRDDDPPRKAA